MILAYVCMGLILALFMFRFCYILLTPIENEIFVYEEYETAVAIAEKWHDSKLIGECGECGRDDAPIVIHKNTHEPMGFNFSNKCKWCAEFDNITWHLTYKTNGKSKL